jgi:hypothetical protein
MQRRTGPRTGSDLGPTWCGFLGEAGRTARCPKYTPKLIFFLAYQQVRPAWGVFCKTVGSGGVTSALHTLVGQTNVHAPVGEDYLHKLFKGARGCAARLAARARYMRSCTTGC